MGGASADSGFSPTLFDSHTRAAEHGTGPLASLAESNGITWPDAALRGEHYARRSSPLFGEDLNDTCKRTRAVNRALRPAHNLDPVDIVRGEVGKIKCALQALIDRNAVEQNLRVFAAKSAGKDRRQLAGHSGLHYGQPRHFAQSIADALDLFLLQLLRVDHARACGRLVQRNIETRGRDHD